MDLASRELRVVVIGGASWNTIVSVDRFPQPRPGSVHARDWYEDVGSSGAGKALNLVRLGVSVTLAVALGDDEEGRHVADVLTGAGVQLVVGSDPGPTARHVNLMDAAGQRLSVMFQRPGAPRFDVSSLEPAIAEADAVCVEIVDHARPLVPAVQRAGRPIWTDLHDYDGEDAYREDFIEAAEVVLFSSDRLTDPRPVMERLRRRGKRLVVCTLGDKGALALDEGGGWHEVPPEPAERVDTNGAGDAFAAGLIVGQLLGRPLGDSLAMAARAAALAVGARELASPGLSLARVIGGHPA